MSFNATETLFTDEFDPADWGTWTKSFLVVYWTVIMLGQELMAALIGGFASCFMKRIPVTGKHLDQFTWLDWLFVYINRISVPVMTYHLFSFTWRAQGHVEWDMEKMSLLNTLGSLIGLFLVYDCIYAPYHGLLHHRLIYKYIHKHHHRQAAPSRGNVDASNTHPFEFISGEYIHLLAVYIVPCHAVSVLAFIVVGGIMASLNHTRIDTGIPFFYDVKAHDKHHHNPNSNFGQYTMYMDKLMGTYRENAFDARRAKKDL